MKSKKKLLRPVALTPPPLPGAKSLPKLTIARPGPTRSKPTARREVDPEHRFHEPGRPSDLRPIVASTGAMSRIRAHQPEFHKKAPVPVAPVAGAPVRRKIHGGLVSKRRAGR
jgi:hypothetical protein